MFDLTTFRKGISPRLPAKAFPEGGLFDWDSPKTNLCE